MSGTWFIDRLFVVSRRTVDNVRKRSGTFVFLLVAALFVDFTVTFDRMYIIVFLGVMVLLSARARACVCVYLLNCS